MLIDSVLIPSTPLLGVDPIQPFIMFMAFASPWALFVSCVLFYVNVLFITTFTFYMYFLFVSLCFMLIC